MAEPLRIVAPFHAPTGYSTHARALLRQALDAGYAVSAVESDTREVIDITWPGEDDLPTTNLRRETNFSMQHVPECQWDELEEATLHHVPDTAPTIVLTPPLGVPAWANRYQGPRIAYTMLESDGVPARVAASLRCVDLILTPSRYVTEVFRRGIAGARVETLPEPVDPRLHLGAEPIPVEDRPGFLFLCVGTTRERKHWREMLHAFAEEFRGESAGLLWHTQPSSDAQRLAADCRHLGAWVRIYDRDLDYRTMARLYAACDCYVGPGHEGYGLPFLEAALHAKASIALETGGQADLVTEETGYRIPSFMAPCVGQMPIYFDSSHHWASCTVPALKQTMRRAVEDPWRVRKGLAAQTRALCGFTPAALAASLIERVDLAKELWRSRAGALYTGQLSGATVC